MANLGELTQEQIIESFKNVFQSIEEWNKFREKNKGKIVLLSKVIAEQDNKDWTNIVSSFTEELKKEWLRASFTYESCKEWIDIGLKLNDYNFAKWLRDVKKKDPNWVLNHGDAEQLRKEWTTQTQITKERLEELVDIETKYHILLERINRMPS